MTQDSIDEATGLDIKGGIIIVRLMHAGHC
jgi:hypothetical protein